MAVEWLVLGPPLSGDNGGPKEPCTLLLNRNSRTKPFSVTRSWYTPAASLPTCRRPLFPTLPRICDPWSMLSWVKARTAHPITDL